MIGDGPFGDWERLSLRIVLWGAVAKGAIFAVTVIVLVVKEMCR